MDEYDDGSPRPATIEARRAAAARLRSALADALHHDRSDSVRAIALERAARERDLTSRRR